MMHAFEMLALEDSEELERGMPRRGRPAMQRRWQPQPGASHRPWPRSWPRSWPKSWPRGWRRPAFGLWPYPAQYPWLAAAPPEEHAPPCPCHLCQAAASPFEVLDFGHARWRQRRSANK